MPAAQFQDVYTGHSFEHQQPVASVSRYQFNLAGLSF